MENSNDAIEKEQQNEITMDHSVEQGLPSLSENIKEQCDQLHHNITEYKEAIEIEKNKHQSIKNEIANITALLDQAILILEPKEKEEEEPQKVEEHGTEENIMI